jgi:hypothetical protein
VTVAAPPALDSEIRSVPPIMRSPARPAGASAAHLVPMEFIGLARRLRTRVAKAHGLWELRADKLLMPFRPRPGFMPMPRRAHLARLAKQWRALPRFGRLRCLVNVKDGALQIAESRLAPSRLKLPWWDEDDEPALSLMLRTVAIVPPRFAEAEMTMVVVGLHALGRRYERGVPGDLEVICEHCRPVTQAVSADKGMILNAVLAI